MKYIVQIVTRVPLFAEMTIEADSAQDAQFAAEAALADLTPLQWKHGEGAEHPVTFPLDERDFHEAEVQAVIAP